MKLLERITRWLERRAAERFPDWQPHPGCAPVWFDDFERAQARVKELEAENHQVRNVMLPALRSQVQQLTEEKALAEQNLKTLMEEIHKQYTVVGSTQWSGSILSTSYKVEPEEEPVEEYEEPEEPEEPEKNEEVKKQAEARAKTARWREEP